MPPVNGVGEPCAGEPHARFDAARAGNGAPGHGHAVKRPAGETRGKVAAGPHAGQRHRASPRPYEGARQPVPRRRRTKIRLWDQSDLVHAGDPVRAAEIIVRVVKRVALPSHLLLGANAVKMALDYSRHQLAEAETWAEVGRSADFNEAYPAKFPADESRK